MGHRYLILRGNIYFLQARKKALRDPMLHHLTDEEKSEYLRTRQQSTHTKEDEDDDEGIA